MGRLLLAIIPALFFLIPDRSCLPAEKSADVKLTVLMVWASDEAKDEKVPKELEKLVGQLKKSSKKKSFRLEGKPTSETLGQGKVVSVKLPSGYEGRWSLEKGSEKKLSVRQVLVNPKKVESVDILKKSPAITHLEKIRQGKETFFLVAQFEKEETKA